MEEWLVIPQQQSHSTLEKKWNIPTASFHCQLRLPVFGRKSMGAFHEELKNKLSLEMYLYTHTVLGFRMEIWNGGDGITLFAYIEQTRN